jgi:hypothetical protein
MPEGMLNPAYNVVTRADLAVVRFQGDSPERRPVHSAAGRCMAEDLYHCSAMWMRLAIHPAPKRRRRRRTCPARLPGTSLGLRGGISGRPRSLGGLLSAPDRSCPRGFGGAGTLRIVAHQQPQEQPSEMSLGERASAPIASARCWPRPNSPAAWVPARYRSTSYAPPIWLDVAGSSPVSRST